MFHDGRAADMKAQAKGPFLDPSGMMMPDAAAVIARVTENPDYVAALQTLYGTTVFEESDTAYDAVAESIAAFEQTEAFAPFDSKYDRSQLPETDVDHYTMTATEQDGYTLFFDTNRTNCALCHSVSSGTEGTVELFTNYTYENTGTPRNLEALQARDGHTRTVDLGLGGRSDINDTALYGMLKVPTLRNVAVTGPYMSNGVFKELRTVLAFYDHMRGGAITRPIRRQASPGSPPKSMPPSTTRYCSKASPFPMMTSTPSKRF